MYLTEKQARAEIQRYDKTSLIQMWDLIRNQPPGDAYPNPHLHSDGSVTDDKPEPKWKPGQAFEYFILRCFELDKSTVTYPYGHIIGLNGKTQETDGVIYTRRLSCLVESKDINHDVQMKVVAKLRHRLMDRSDLMIGCVFTSRKSYKYETFALAHFYQDSKLILLWNGDEIEALLKNKRSFVRALGIKYMMAVEKLCPYYDTQQESPYHKFNDQDLKG